MTSCFSKVFVGKSLKSQQVSLSDNTRRECFQTDLGGQKLPQQAEKCFGHHGCAQESPPPTA